MLDGVPDRDVTAYQHASIDLVALETGVVHYGVDLASPGSERTVRHHERPRETLREWAVRTWKRPMGTLKDDDPRVTWDHKAMAARPFRARKD